MESTCAWTAIYRDRRLCHSVRPALVELSSADSFEQGAMFSFVSIHVC